MADTMGTPVKAFKKKKAFAFLKSAPKPTPSLESNGDHLDKEAGEDDDGLDLFRRSRDFFPVVVQEQEHRQATPEENTAEQNRLSRESTLSPSPPSSKRRKLSSPARIDDFRETSQDLYGPPTPPRRIAKSRSASPRKPHAKQATPSPAKSKGKERAQPVQSDILLTPTRSSSNQPCANEFVSLDDEDDDVAEVFPVGTPAVATTASTRASKDVSISREEETPSPGPITIDDSDDDVFENPNDAVDDDDPFAHFIQRAREREAAAKAEAAAASARSEIQPLTPEGGPRQRRDHVVEVKIFVQSRIAKFPDVEPFGAKRGMNQNLGVIRRTFFLWLRKAGYTVSEEDEANIFLTWKRRKIYDVSTGVSLGWNPSVAEDSSSSSTPGFTKRGVLLEAWTQQDFDDWVAEEEKERMMKRGDLVEDISEDETVEEQVKDTRIRISIKEKDKEEFKMAVDLDTKVCLLIAVIRKMRKIPNDRNIKLRYEGEWLEGDVTIEGAEIEDLDTIEMYLR